MSQPNDPTPSIPIPEAMPETPAELLALMERPGRQLFTADEFRVGAAELPAGDFVARLLRWISVARIQMETDDCLGLIGGGELARWMPIVRAAERALEQLTGGAAR
jgi:hypothetical protein